MKRLAGFGLALALSACSQPPQLSVDGAWVRLAAVPDRPAAAYFTIHGGPVDQTLISVSTDIAVTTAMHRSTGGRMAGMVPLDSVAVPALKDVAFRPGGLHAMLFHVNPGIRPGGSVTLRLGFSDGTRLERKARVIGAGDPAPE